MENRPSCLRMEYILAARYQRCVGPFADLRFDIFPGCYRPFLVLPRFHSPLAPLSSADALQPDSDILPSFFCRSFCLLHHLKSVDRFGQLPIALPDKYWFSMLVSRFARWVVSGWLAGVPNHSLYRSFILSIARQPIRCCCNSVIRKL